MKYYVFRYTNNYHKMQGAEIVTDLFNDPTFQTTFQLLGKNRQWKPLSGHVSSIQISAVPATLTRLEMFDRLVEQGSPPAVRSNGDITKCLEDYADGFQISDRLRELILNEECDNYSIYSAEERSELLWHIFEHLCLGGACCQFEDKIDAYLDITKSIYKELLRGEHVSIHIKKQLLLSHCGSPAASVQALVSCTCAILVAAFDRQLMVDQ